MKKYKYHLLDNDLVKEFEDGEIYTVANNPTMRTLMLYLNEADKQMRNAMIKLNESLPISKLEELIKSGWSVPSTGFGSSWVVDADDLQRLINETKQP